jgi:uncharacterized membrane protein
MKRDISWLTRMNDWPIFPFLTFVFSVQFLLIVVIVLDSSGITVPIIRPVLGIVYLLFIPGLLVLRALRLHKLSGLETSIYALGISLTLEMLLGVLINVFYTVASPAGDLAQGPLATPVLTIAMALLVIGLSVTAFLRDRTFACPTPHYFEYFTPTLIFLLALPLLAVLSAFVMTTFGLDILIIALVFLIAAFVLFSAFTKRVADRYHPIAIFTIALALLWSRSVLSTYVWGWDINLELLFARLVYTSSAWNANLAWDVNAMPSVVILAPIIAKITGLDLVWVFKLVYPLIFAFVPLGIYKVAKSQTTPAIAFFSAFFFMSIFVFFEEMLQLARQEIAELYLVLIVLLIVDRKMHRSTRWLLLITFALSLVISHYGLTYIAITLLVTAWLIMSLRERPIIARWWSRTRRPIATKSIGAVRYSDQRRVTKTAFILLFVVLASLWYGFVASGAPLNHGLQSGGQIITSLASFLDPKATQALYIVQAPTTSLLRTITKDLTLVSLGFFAIGLFVVLAALVSLRFAREFLALSIASFIILGCCVVVPFFANQLNTSRMYQIASIFSGLFIVLGLLTVVRLTNALFRRQPVAYSDGMKIFALFAVVFLLFNTGTIYSLAGDAPAPIFGGMRNTESYPIFNQKEVAGATWLAERFGALQNTTGQQQGFVYGDNHRYWLLLGFNIPSKLILSNASAMSRDSFVFVGTYNIAHQTVLVDYSDKAVVGVHTVNVTKMISNRSLLYDSGGSHIYGMRNV